MPTELERSHMTAGSETVVYNRLALRVKAKSHHANWVIVTPYASMYGTVLSAQPLQSEGESSQSRDIGSRLASAVSRYSRCGVGITPADPYDLTPPDWGRANGPLGC